MDFENELIGCAYDCPVQDRKTDCPFNEIVHLKFKEKVIWMRSIEKRKKESIVQHHLVCIAGRTINLKPNECQ